MQAGAEGLEERGERFGRGPAVASGEAVEVGLPGALQEDLVAGGRGLAAEEDAEAAARFVVGDVVGEERHHAVVQVDGAGGVATGVAAARVGDDAGQPQGHAGTLSGRVVCRSR